LVPVLVIGGAVAATVWRSTRAPDTTTGPAVAVESGMAGGVRFEVEHRPGSEKFLWAWGADDAAVVRGEDRLDFRFGIPVVNGTTFPSPAPGDTVRWNLEGPLLINGRPVAPHRFQPKQLDAPPTELTWEIKNPSDAPRDSLSADWSKVGRVLVTAHGDGCVRVWDVEKRAARTLITPDAPTTGRKRWGFKAAVSPDGKTVAAANVQAPAVTLWEADTGKLLATLAEPAGNVTGLRFASDRALLEARGGTLYARDLTGDRSKVTKLGTVHTEVSVSFALDGGTLATNDGKQVTLQRPAIPGFPPPDHPFGRTIDGATSDDPVALSPDGGTLAVAATGTLALHDARGDRLPRSLWWRKRPDGVAAPISALAFFADGKTLAVGAADGLRLYDVESGRERGWVQTLGIRSLAGSGDGAFLAAACEHGPAVYLWPVADLQPK
jgi:WD40 repeat protein